MNTESKEQKGKDATRLLSAVRLAETVIKVMDVKGRAGSREPSWLGYQNGNGTEIGVDIERMIKQAKRFLANYGYKEK